MSIVRASSKYQIAIPKNLRVKLGIKPGQKLMADEKDGAIVLVPIPSDPIDFLCGIIKEGPSLTAELLKDRARDLEHE